MTSAQRPVSNRPFKIQSAMMAVFKQDAFGQHNCNISVTTASQGNYRKAGMVGAGCEQLFVITNQLKNGLRIGRDDEAVEICFKPARHSVLNRRIGKRTFSTRRRDRRKKNKAQR